MKQFIMVILKDAAMAGLPLDSEDMDTIAFFEKSLYKAKQHADWYVGEINKVCIEASLSLKKKGMAGHAQECKLISVAEIKGQ